MLRTEHSLSKETSQTQKKVPFAKSLKVAVVGIGGYAEKHHAQLLALEKQGLLKVIATCDPKAKELAQHCNIFRFHERRISVYENWESLLRVHQSQLDLALIVAPIQFHASLHRSCVEHGIACYLEKPPTLEPEELEGMIEIEKKAIHATQVGFNHIYQPFRQELKQRILSKEFGKVLQVSFLGLWQRKNIYYNRNKWAGKLVLGDHLLLDSCCGNGMSHHLHNILFFADTKDLMSWADPQSMDAELYRANQIEGCDSMFARGLLKNGVAFQIAASHACKPSTLSVERIICEKATIEIVEEAGCILLHTDGRVEEISAPAPNLNDNIRIYCEHLLGYQLRPITKLTDCRPFVNLNALFYLAAKQIHQIESPFAMKSKLEEDKEEGSCIQGIERACWKTINNNKLPSEQSIPWGKPGSRSDVSELAQLRSVVEKIRTSH